MNLCEWFLIELAYLQRCQERRRSARTKES